MIFLPFGAGPALWGWRHFATAQSAFCRRPPRSTLGLQPDFINRSTFQPTKSTKSAVILALDSTSTFLADEINK